MVSRVCVWSVCAAGFILLAAGFVSGCERLGQKKQADRQENSQPAGAPGEVHFEAEAEAPEFSLPDLSGRVRSLTEYRSKVVMLNFWATWCAPCIAEMPEMQQVYQRFGPEGLEIVSINIDNSNHLSSVVSFVKESKITFPVLRDEKLKVVNQYGVSGFPETFFIGRSGKFLKVEDPLAGESSVRILSDRPWNSTEYRAVIEGLLAEPSAASPEAQQ